jgi:hypothetical protein
MLLGGPSGVPFVPPAGAGQPSGMVRVDRLTPTVLWRMGHKPFLAAQKSPGRCRGFSGAGRTGNISTARRPVRRNRRSGS